MTTAQYSALSQEFLEKDCRSSFGDQTTRVTTINKPYIRVEESSGKNTYISTPWSPQIYFTVRGSENFHIYLWIAKDFAWTQDLYYESMFFGIAALVWCGVLMYHAIKLGYYNEIYMLIPFIMWLSANFTWMAGEVYHNDDDYVDPRSAIVMQSAIAWILVYYVVLKPLKVFPNDDTMSHKYDDAGLHPRFSYFANWREYEHAHTLCWLGKDLCWLLLEPIPWVMCLIPTVLIASDFIWSTWKTKRMAIDCAHYIAQLIWVFGNAMWALGELFDIPGNDDDASAYSIWNATSTAIKKCRWWSSMILIWAFIPLVCLYMIWLPLTCMGMIQAADIPENKEYYRESFLSGSAFSSFSFAVQRPAAAVSDHKEDVYISDMISSSNNNRPNSIRNTLSHHQHRHYHDEQQLDDEEEAKEEASQFDSSSTITNNNTTANSKNNNVMNQQRQQQVSDTYDTPRNMLLHEEEDVEQR